MIEASKVSACIVTRGNVPLDDIIATLPYDDIVIWNNAEKIADMKVYGRYLGMLEARHDVIYFQDDDVIFRHHAELLAAWEPPYTANNAHGDNDGGYGDLALPGAGSLMFRRAAWRAIGIYLRANWPDEGFLYEADYIVGALTPFQHVELPYERLYQDDDSRMCRQPWQEGLKEVITNRARRLRAG